MTRRAGRLFTPYQGGLDVTTHPAGPPARDNHHRDRAATCGPDRSARRERGTTESGHDSVGCDGRQHVPDPSRELKMPVTSIWRTERRSPGGPATVRRLD